MPIALDPNQTFTVVLKSDATKPDPPSFTFRYLTGRQWIALSEFDDKRHESKATAAERMTELARLISSSLVSWRGLPIEYDPDCLLDVVNPIELYELSGALLYRLDAEDKKKSASPSPSPEESSASVAEQVTA